MKQYITREQLNELSEKGEKRLDKWVVEKQYYIYSDDTNLSIGKMIEFLEGNLPNDGLDFDFGFNSWFDQIAHYTIDDDGIHPNYEGELCDALWEAVKEILEAS